MNNRCVEFHSSIIDEGIKCNIPRLETIRAIIRLAWACAGGNMQLLVDSAATEMLHFALHENEPEEEDVLGENYSILTRLRIIAICDTNF